MTGFLAFARGEACQASPLCGLSPVLFGWWDLSPDASPLPSRCFFFFAGTRLWSSRVSHCPLLLCASRAHFFFSPPTPRLWSSRVSMSPLGLRRVGPDRPALVCLPSARLFYWIPRGPPTAVFLAWRCEGFFFFFCGMCWVCGASLARFFRVTLCRSMWCDRPVFIRAGGLSRARRGTDIHGEWRPLFSFCQRAPRLSSPPLPVVCGRQGCGYPA